MNAVQYDTVLATLGRIAVALEAIVGSDGKTPKPVEADSPVNPWVSPDVPAGYDTVLGFLSKTHPEVLDMMDDPIEGTQRDGFWLKHRAFRQQIGVLSVAAPADLVNYGIETVNAYPVTLLQERFK